MELLRNDMSLDDVPQSGVVSDATLEQVLDRRYLMSGEPCPYPPSGVGYEVMQGVQGNASLLQNISEGDEAKASQGR